MNLYYHHVGQDGAALDFTKTIFSDINISNLKRFISQKEISFQYYIYKPLAQECPNGFVNCWGVPEGANYKIKDLEAGDYVLLVESLEYPNLILAEVIAYRHQKFAQLSNYLWGSNKFPYIFFIKWNYLDLNWRGFCRLINYSIEYNPRGLFLNISKDIANQHGGIGNLMLKLEHYIIKKLSN
jgi:5-methylcytosine-specific restriction enzyme A